MKTRRYPIVYPPEYFDEGKYFYPTNKADEDIGRVYNGSNEGATFSDNSTEAWLNSRDEFSVHNDINWERYIRSQEKMRRLRR